jgi:hypothetical protein
LDSSIAILLTTGERLVDWEKLCLSTNAWAQLAGSSMSKDTDGEDDGSKGNTGIGGVTLTLLNKSGKVERLLRLPSLICLAATLL